MVRSILLLAVALGLLYSILAKNLSNDAVKQKNGKGRRIVGGKAARRHQFPYHVALVKSDGFPYCGASLIDEHFIITAAHCKTPIWKTTRIFAGGHNFKELDGSEQYQPIKEFIIHEGYDKDEYVHDIGVIYVAQPFILNDNVTAVKLATDDNYPTGKVTISGWGITEGRNLSSSAETLQTAVLDIIPFKTCEKKWLKKWGEDDVYPENCFCAAVDKKRIDFCDGDSGGPAVQAKDDGKVLLGITNFSADECANATQPGSFLLIPRYIDWINKTKAAILARQNGEAPELEDSDEMYSSSDEEYLTSDELYPHSDEEEANDEETEDEDDDIENESIEF